MLRSDLEMGALDLNPARRHFSFIFDRESTGTYAEYLRG